jgi:hypothetical protein
MSGFEVLGVVANIIQVVDFSFAVLNRLKEYQSTIGELPKSLKHTKIQLPALLDALNLMKASIENDSMKESSRAALLPIIDGCRSQIEALDGVMKLILPVASDSRIQRNTKALKSLRYQGKIDKIMSVIKIYIQTLSYYVSTLSALRGMDPVSLALRML